VHRTASPGRRPDPYLGLKRTFYRPALVSVESPPTHDEGLPLKAWHSAHAPVFRAGSDCPSLRRKPGLESLKVHAEGEISLPQPCEIGLSFALALLLRGGEHVTRILAKETNAKCCFFHLLFASSSRPPSGGERGDNKISTAKFLRSHASQRRPSSQSSWGRGENFFVPLAVPSAGRGGHAKRNDAFWHARSASEGGNNDDMVKMEATT